MLKMFEPTTLPTAMSGWRRSAAATEVASSGHARPGGDDGQPDHGLAHVQRARDRGRGGDEEVGPQDESNPSPPATKSRSTRIDPDVDPAPADSPSASACAWRLASRMLKDV